MPSLRLIYQAAVELGPGQLALYGLYRFGLKTGHYRRLTPPRLHSLPSAHPAWKLRTDLWPLPDQRQLQEITAYDVLLAEADEILSGKVRLFGGQPVPLVLRVDGPLQHWTEVSETSQDIKPIWEAGRFGWAVSLARAYRLSANPDYAACFWDYTHTFLDANPANLGPHWSSAQEVALRLIALVFAIQVFSASPATTSPRLGMLTNSLAEHAARIPPTLVYARAQNNNHLVSEAAGLYTAAAALPAHPQAREWYRLGWKWLNLAFQRQIASDGSYIQHSTNYHRLMLQLALWASSIQTIAFPDEPFPAATNESLAAATNWLSELLDPLSGGVPNLGPNDGAYILPLSNCPFNDYRPVVQSCGLAFLQKRLVEHGPWDEMPVWFQLPGEPVPCMQTAPVRSQPVAAPHTLRGRESWAYLRAARFTSRPGHADQLHLDLWWRGLNIALDPGTYLYTAPQPWDNALTHTAVHNTLMVDGHEQMRRAGRFLYLDWAQSETPHHERATDGSWQRLTAGHTGYRHLGIFHQRGVTLDGQDQWLVSDNLTGPADQKQHTTRLHWLLPDWDYELDASPEQGQVRLHLASPLGRISLKVTWMDARPNLVQTGFAWGLARAGKLLAGEGPVHPTWGWTSPTYGDKIPALAFYVTVTASLPIHLESQWGLPIASLLS